MRRKAPAVFRFLKETKGGKEKLFYAPFCNKDITMPASLCLQDAVSLLTERAAAYGADGAESFAANNIGISAECRLQKAEALEYSKTAAVDLRVFCGKRQAVVSSSVLDEKSLDELADRAVRMAKCVPEDPYCGLAEPDMLACDFPDLDLYDSDVPSTGALLEKAMKAEAAGLDVKGVVNSDGASASYGSSEIIMLSTAGFSKTFRLSGSGISASLIAQDKNGGKETDYEYSSAVHASDLDSPESVGKKAAQRTVGKLGAHKIESAEMSVVFEPRHSKSLLGHFAAAINGAAVARGTSFLKDCLNERLFPEHIGIIEEPLRKRGMNSRAFDSEGLPTATRAFIENGVLTSWVLDLHSARRLGMKPTGNGVRPLGGTPHPSVSNLTLYGENISPEDLMSDIKRGVYITGLFGQGVNPVTGDYSKGASGFMIENGRLTFPVHEITIAGNLKEMFSELRAANDLEIRYAFNAPTVRSDRMSVAGK